MPADKWLRACCHTPLHQRGSNSSQSHERVRLGTISNREAPTTALSESVLSMVTEIMVMFCGGFQSRLVARITVEIAACWRERRRPGFVGRCAVSDERLGWGKEHL